MSLMVSIVCFLFSIIFLIVFLLLNIKALDLAKVEGTITDISEHRHEEPDWISPLIYFYPEITYQYEYVGKKYVGEVGKYHSTKFRVSEFTPGGNKREDRDYFWRCWDIGDSIQVEVKLSNPIQSSISGYESKTYLSQNRAYFILAVIFALLGTIAIVI